MPKCSRWCWRCYEGIRARAVHKGHYGWSAASGPRVYYTESPMKRPAAMPGKKGDPVVLRSQESARRWPQLVAYMTDELWDDGKTREKSTVTLTFGDGVLHGSLNDRAMKRSLWRSGDTPEEVLDALEAALADERADWRSWKK